MRECTITLYKPIRLLILKKSINHQQLIKPSGTTVCTLLKIFLIFFLHKLYIFIDLAGI